MYSPIVYWREQGGSMIRKRIQFNNNHYVRSPPMSPGGKTGTVPVVVRRSFLIRPEILGEFSRKCSENLVRVEREWLETYFDTKSSSLSNAECILMKDSTSPKFWKFFCYHHANIMEMTTDEQEIKEPLHRLLQFDRPADVTADLLRPFFSIKCATKSYLVEGCEMRLTMTDYGFAHCTLARHCLQHELLAEVIDEINRVAKLLGLQSLADYEPLDYLLSGA